MSDPFPYVTTGQAADMLGVDATTIPRWCDQGDLPCQRVGHLRAIPRADVRRLLIKRRWASAQRSAG